MAGNKQQKYGKTKLIWWQKIAINIQDWWYDKR